MAKKLYLICNAHIDPVWQWEWEEGAAETLSTFKIAADFCEEYEHFVFCHNEALLYRWVEEYDSALFARIQSLVKQKKWHIMGGWHLQPDCNLPSGESFVRQILSGRKYFQEKFGVEPNVAVNLDPFGHTRGLVQILTKCGYDGYLFMRPGEGDRFIKLPADEFSWVGYDGSKVTAVRIPGGYNSGRGKAADKVRDYIDKYKEDDFLICLWGIGNHGGGPSKKDLEDLAALAREQKKQDVELVHSTPEEYIAAVRERAPLPVWDKGITPFATGCYTSQIRIKQKYRLAENTYYLTEMMCTHAHSHKLMEYPEEDLAAAMYDILFVQFHDILPGSSIQPVEEACLRTLDHALEILSRLKAKAFFALTAGQKKAVEDRIPICIYNPYPYEVEGDFQCEFMLWDQNRTDDFMQAEVCDEQGIKCPAQCEKEHSTLPLEWRKRVLFHGKLKPMSMNRFDCAFYPIPKKVIEKLSEKEGHYIFCKGDLCVSINRRTGLVDQISQGNEAYMTENAFALEVYADTYDPWSMNQTAWKDKVGEFTLLSREDAAEFCGMEAPIDAVRIIEGGEVRTIVEAVFGYETSRAVVKYILSNTGSVKVDVRLQWNEKQKMVKMNVPAAFTAEECIGEQAYGREVLQAGMEENISQKYTALCSGNLAVLAMNNGVYGSSFDNETSSLKITLLRSPSYCAHPMSGRETMPKDRYMPHMEQGERDYSFGFAFGEKQEILDKASRMAQAFNMEPMALSFYATGKGEQPAAPLSLTDTEIINITAFKKAVDGEGYIVRLFNPVGEPQTAVFSFRGCQKKLSFGKYEIKTIRCHEDSLEEMAKLEQ